MVRAADEMKNLFLEREKIEYKIDDTLAGRWRRFMYSDGKVYQEFVSHADVLGVPLIHYTSGISPETGRTKVAKGFIAIGRRAIGFIALGQLAIGVLAIGQLGLGLLFGLGQATTGLVAIGQAAIGGALGVGQAATGALAIGQFSLGFAALGQISAGYFIYATTGVAVHPWTLEIADPAALQFFQILAP